MIKEPEKKTSTPIKNPETGLEIKKSVFISVPYFPAFSEEFRKIFNYISVQVNFKGTNTLKSILMHPKDNVTCITS